MEREAGTSFWVDWLNGLNCIFSSIIISTITQQWGKGKVHVYICTATMEVLFFGLSLVEVLLGGSVNAAEEGWNGSRGIQDGDCGVVAGAV